MDHLLTGAALPFVIGLIVYSVHCGRISIAGLIIWPITVLFGMLWAVMPDVPRVLGFRDLYMKLSVDPRCDLFFGHYSMDLVESDTPLFAIPVVVMCGLMLFIAYRELLILESER